MTPTLDVVIAAKYPGAEWVLYGNSYDGLMWLDKVTPKPSPADLGLQ